MFKVHAPPRGSTSSLPANWKAMPSHVPVESVKLDPNDSDYKAVARHFESSLASVKRTIIQVSYRFNPYWYVLLF